MSTEDTQSPQEQALLESNTQYFKRLYDESVVNAKVYQSQISRLNREVETLREQVIKLQLNAYCCPAWRELQTTSDELDDDEYRDFNYCPFCGEQKHHPTTEGVAT